MNQKQILDDDIARVIFKEIVDGDRRKFVAQSNDTDSGGGARDLRFRPFRQLSPIFKKFFPKVNIQPRKRKGKTVEMELMGGSFYWTTIDGVVKSMPSLFEPPTDARPNEGRIARVHEYPCFDLDMIPEGGDANNPVLLLLIQNGKGEVWVHFTNEDSLRNQDGWDQNFASSVLDCIHKHRPSRTSIVGYIDYESGESYCNGK